MTKHQWTTGMRPLLVCFGLAFLMLQVSAQTSNQSEGPWAKANYLHERGYFQRAEPLILEALDQFRQAQMLDEELEALFLLEEVYDQLYLCGERQAVLDQLLDLTETRCGLAHPLTNKVHVRQADLYVDMGKSKRGKEYLEPFEQKFREQGDYRSLIGLQLVVGHYLQKRGNFLGTRASFKKALEISTKYCPSQYELRYLILAELMIANQRAGNFINALEYGEQQLKLLSERPIKTVRDSISIAKVNMYLGSTHSRQGNLELAIEYGDLAFAQFHQIPGLPVSYKGATLFCKFAAYTGFGGSPEQLQQALKSSIEAERLMENPSNKLLASYSHINLLNIIRFTSYTDTPENAVRYEQAVKLVERWGLDPFLALIIGSGLAYKKGDYGSSLDFAKESLGAFYREYGIENSSYGYLGVSFLRIGMAYEKQMALDSAAIYFHKTVANFTESFRSDNLEDNPGTEHGSTSFFLLDAILFKGWALEGLYEFHQDPKYLEMAHQAYLSGILIGDSLRDEYDGQSSKLELSGRILAQHEGLISTGIRLHELTGKTSYLEQAFISSEKAKSLLLLESQNNTATRENGGLPASIEEEIDSLRRELVLVNGELLNESSYGEERDTSYVSGLNQKRVDLSQRLRAWDDRIKQEYPDYGRDNGNQMAMLPKLIQDSLLQENEVVLEYFIGTKELYTFSIDQHELKAHRQPLPKDFDALIGRFARSTSDYRFITDSVATCYREYTNLGHQLYEILVKPLMDENSKSSKLILVPDGSLHQVPFEALLTSLPQQEKVDYLNLRYLLKRNPVHYAFSAASLLENQRSEGNTKGIQCLALAPEYEGVISPGSHGDLRTLRGAKGKLEGAQREVQAIAELDVDGEFLFGEMASEKNFKSMAAEYGVLHVAMHGQSDNSEPGKSNLAFSEIKSDSSEDHLLHAYELDVIPFNAELVVLSACESGVGKFIPGEGAMSLGRSFMANGAKSVVTTLWKVEDETSSALMSSFYGHLVEGVPTGEALRQAKLEQLARADSRTAHPYFWAGYISNGASKTLDFSRPTNWLGWLFGVAGGLLAIGIVFRLTRPAGRSIANESD